MAAFSSRGRDLSAGLPTHSRSPPTTTADELETALIQLRAKLDVGSKQPFGARLVGYLEDPIASYWRSSTVHAHLADQPAAGARMKRVDAKPYHPYHPEHAAGDQRAVGAAHGG